MACISLIVNGIHELSYLLWKKICSVHGFESCKSVADFGQGPDGQWPNTWKEDITWTQKWRNLYSSHLTGPSSTCSALRIYKPSCLLDPTSQRFHYHTLLSSTLNPFRVHWIPFMLIHIYMCIYIFYFLEPSDTKIAMLKSPVVTSGLKVIIMDTVLTATLLGQ